MLCFFIHPHLGRITTKSICKKISHLYVPLTKKFIPIFSEALSFNITPLRRLTCILYLLFFLWIVPIGQIQVFGFLDENGFAVSS